MKVLFLIFLTTFTVQLAIGEVNNINITGNKSVEVFGTVDKREFIDVHDGTGHWYSSLELEPDNNKNYKASAKITVVSTNQNFSVKLVNPVELINPDNNETFSDIKLEFSSIDEKQKKMLIAGKAELFKNPDIINQEFSEGQYKLNISAKPPNVKGTYIGEISLIFEISA